jgi:hypothetical protein
VIVEDLTSPKRGAQNLVHALSTITVLAPIWRKNFQWLSVPNEGKMARQYFIDCEERLRRVAPEEHEAALLTWRKNRVAACEDHKSMADAMKGYIERTGDKQHGFAYSNECSFLNSLALGMHRELGEAERNPVKQVRDHMNAEQLALLAYLESRNCALLDLDTSTATRKTKLTELAQRWLVKEWEEQHDRG